MATTTNFLQTVQKIGAEIKKDRTLINGNVADLAALSTTAKGNLVLAINETLAEALAAKTLAASAAQIDDGTISATKTWTSQKITAMCEEFCNIARGEGADLGTYKTVKQASDAIDLIYSTVIPGLSVSIAGSLNYVDYSKTQALTVAQKDTACANIGALNLVDFGDPDTDFLAAFNTALA